MSRIVEDLKRHEGVILHGYYDHLNYMTCGVGRCLEEGVGIGLTMEEAEYLLANDIARVREELTKTFEWFEDLNEPRQEAMINLNFNLGLTKLRGFKMALAAMAENDFDEAADQFMDSRWSSQVGRRAVEVTEQIRTGEYAD